ncbi:MAG: NTP transferase domain-containing protein [Candidatus Marinimicrobia bacterium]|nr:NTP transferase domain-containing protein [FCB group bacterium]MBL7025911.1 NTP transferase domain-containing protein [Candidatus Neomarinimicrobiota bacterium]
MKAMLFAAGRGTRLAPLTDRHPKCLVTAGGKTLLEHNILKIQMAGVDTLVINTHHFSDQVKDFVRTRDFGLTIHISEEKDLLGQGGGLLYASKYFQGEDAFLVCNSDIYSELDLNELLSAHNRSQSLATLAVAKRETSRYLRFDQNNNLCGWENQKTGEKISWNTNSYEKQAFNGIQVISSGIFEYMSDLGTSFSTIPVYLKAAQSGENIKAFPMDQSYWIDIGTVEKLETLRQHLI